MEPAFKFIMRDRLFLLSGIFGIGALAMTLILSIISPRVVGSLPPGFITPVMAFEFAATEQEVWQIFQPPGSAAAMDRVNHWDFLFMAFYCLMLGAFALAAARQSGQRALIIAAALAPVILFADAMENVQLLGLTHGTTLDGGSLAPQLARLRVYTWLKWGGLAIYFLLLLPYFRWRGGRWRLMQMLTVLPAVFALFALVARGLPNELMALFIGLMFVMLTVESWRWVVVSRRQILPSHGL